MAAQSSSVVALNPADSNSQISQNCSSTENDTHPEAISPPSNGSQILNALEHPKLNDPSDTQNEPGINTDKSLLNDQNCDTKLSNEDPSIICDLVYPLKDTTIPSKEINGKRQEDIASSKSLTSTSKSDMLSEGNSLHEQSYTHTDCTPPSSSSEPIHEQDAAPFNESARKSHTDDSEPTQNGSATTAATSSVHSASPIDEDDAGPFNIPSYRKHLQGDKGQSYLETFTAKDSPYYDLSRGRKLAVILNQEEYNHYDNQNIPRRTGTERVSGIVITYAF